MTRPVLSLVYLALPVAPTARGTDLARLRWGISKIAIQLNLNLYRDLYLRTATKYVCTGADSSTTCSRVHHTLVHFPSLSAHCGAPAGGPRLCSAPFALSFAFASLAPTLALFAAFAVAARFVAHPRFVFALDLARRRDDDLRCCWFFRCWFCLAGSARLLLPSVQMLLLVT
eukprot:SAG11_NODE_1697_length_4431_cov_2.166667_4_plen_172_part_00